MDEGWQALRKLVRAQEDGFMASLARKLRAGVVVDQREVDYKRGWLEGALFVLDHPDKAMEALELAARTAYLAAKARAQEEEGEDNSPYLR